MADIVNNIIDQSEWLDKMCFRNKQLTVGYNIYLDMIQEFAPQGSGDVVVFLGIPLKIDYDNPELVSVKAVTNG